MNATRAGHSPAPRDSGARVLLGAGVGSLVLGLVVAGVAALTDGDQGAYAALVGTVLVVVVFAFGTLTVNAVAGLLPTASLLVALLTYALQLLVLLVVLSALDGSGLMGETLSRGWLAGTVIVGTLGWAVAQVVLAARARIPHFQLPEEPARDAAAQNGSQTGVHARTGGRS